MSVTFIVLTVIVVIVAGLSDAANKHGTPIGQMINMVSWLMLIGFTINVFYNHGIKSGIIYLIMISIVLFFWLKQ